MLIDKYGIVDVGEGEEPPDSNQVELAKAWIEDNVSPRKTIRKTVSSYALKHMCEQDCGEYVGNGAFIQAALDLGYRAQDNGTGRNAWFNFEIKKESIHAR
jgi:hypothetical protein